MERREVPWRRGDGLEPNASAVEVAGCGRADRSGSKEVERSSLGDFFDIADEDNGIEADLYVAGDVEARAAWEPVCLSRWLEALREDGLCWRAAVEFDSLDVRAVNDSAAVDLGCPPFYNSVC